jgi:hypothetical protein
VKDRRHHNNDGRKRVKAGKTRKDGEILNLRYSNKVKKEKP